MRRIAVAWVLVALAAAADVTWACGNRVRAAARQSIEGPFNRAVEDWQMAVWLALLVAAAATGWVAALDSGRRSRLATAAHIWGRGGTFGAVAGGLVGGVGLTVAQAVLGAASPNLDRYELEVRLLGGAWGGAVVGMAVGGGLGLVRAVRSPAA